MRKLITVALIAASLTGCASRSRSLSYGSFVQGTTPAGDRRMADDVAKKLVALHLPARTRINLIHGTPDAFGVALVGSLRAKGYALAEFKPVTKTGAPRAVTGAAAQPGDVALAYVVDKLLDGGMYRVTVHINTQSLSRLYEMKDGSFASVGYWVRKE